MWFEKGLKYDLWLILGAAGLAGLGIVMIYSTSSITAHQVMHGQSAFFLKKQLISAAIGILIMFAAMRLNYEKLMYLAWPGLIVSILLLAAVLVPGIGVEVNGGRRWIRFLGFGVQPSEMARLALVVFLAFSLSRKQERMKTFKYGFLPYALVSGLMIGLIFLEPDMGGAITLGTIMMIMLFAGGARIPYLAGTVALAVPVMFYFMASEEYRWRRVMATINPWDYLRDAGWQLVQSLLAFGSGGIFGVGLGEGKQKLFYLPDAHTDFILSVIGEELGFIGVCAVVSVFMMVVVRGSIIAMRAPSTFGAYLAFGITAMIGVPALINMMVVMGLLPTKGLVLPFISYGGSALVIYLAAVGILLNVSAKMYRTR